MPAERKISDEELADMHRLHEEEGWSAADLAAEFDVSRQHVGRLLREEQRPTIADPEAVRSSVTAALDLLLTETNLNSADAVLAATARTLASKLDATGASKTAAAAQAAPRIAAELVAVLERLQGRLPREADALDHLTRRYTARQLAAGANGNQQPRRSR